MENSPFAKLAPELRNRIYELVLYKQEGFHFTEDEFGDPHTVCHPSPRPNSYERCSNTVNRHLLALTQVCRDIRSESSSLFFSINAFRIDTCTCAENVNGVRKHHDDCPDRLEACEFWLRAIGPNNASAIQRLEFDFGTWQAWKGATGDSDGLSMSRDNNSWLASTRKIERYVFLLYGISWSIGIRIVVTLEFREILIRPTTYRSTPYQPCFLNPTLSINDCATLTINVPSASSSTALEIAEKSLKEKAEMLRSHELHGCNVTKVLWKLLQGLEASHTSVRSAFCKSVIDC